MMELNEKDYFDIASKIEQGDNSVEFEKGDEVLTVKYSYEEDGYFENDYFNGTGAFVVTEQYFVVNSFVSVNENGVTDNNFSEKRLRDIIYSI